MYLKRVHQLISRTMQEEKQKNIRKANRNIERKEEKKIKIGSRVSVQFDSLSLSKIDNTLTDITAVISNPFNIANQEK